MFKVVACHAVILAAVSVKAHSRTVSEERRLHARAVVLHGLVKPWSMGFWVRKRKRAGDLVNREPRLKWPTTKPES
jgi:hypothetical protein